MATIQSLRTLASTFLAPSSGGCITPDEQARLVSEAAAIPQSDSAAAAAMITSMHDGLRLSRNAEHTRMLGQNLATNHAALGAVLAALQPPARPAPQSAQEEITDDTRVVCGVGEQSFMLSNSFCQRILRENEASSGFVLSSSAGLCLDGYVWRELVQGQDRVCVTLLDQRSDQRLFSWEQAHPNTAYNARDVSGDTDWQAQTPQAPSDNAPYDAYDEARRARLVHDRNVQRAAARVGVGGILLWATSPNRRRR